MLNVLVHQVTTKLEEVLFTKFHAYIKNWKNYVIYRHSLVHGIVQEHTK